MFTQAHFTMITRPTFFLLCLAALSATATLHAQTTLADWTFETSQPSTAGPFTAEISNNGTTAATGSHAGASTYSSPAGNGSSHSFSSTNWQVGDYYQFQLSATGYSNLTLSYDQTSSNTGPGMFSLLYSTDGVNFTQFGSNYTVLANASPNTPWTSTSYNSAYTMTDNLSSISALDSASTIYFRVQDATTTSANGGTTASGGTDRVDNFTVSGTAAVPEPTVSAALGAGAALMLLAARRKGLVNIA